MTRHDKIIAEIEELEDQIEGVKYCLRHVDNTHKEHALEIELEKLQAQKQSLINLSEAQ